MIEATITLSSEESAEKISNCHQAGKDSLINSLKHWSDAGYHLTVVRNTVDDFSKWISENLGFSRKTAYQYIKLHEKVEQGLIDLDSGKFTSLRQCLGIDHDGENSTYSRPPSDKRFESIPGLCTKIEQTWRGVIRAKPLDGWSDDEKRVLANSLKPLLEIHNELNPN
jgi:hypothetical protein